MVGHLLTAIKKITYLKLALDKSKKTVNLNVTVKNFTCEKTKNYP